LGNFVFLEICQDFNRNVSEAGNRGLTVGGHYRPEKNMKLGKIQSLLWMVTLGCAGVANGQSVYSMSYDQDNLGNYSYTLDGTVLLDNTAQPLTAIQAIYLSGATPPTGTPNPFYTFCVNIVGTWSSTPTLTAEPFPTGSQPTPIGWVANGIQTSASIYNAYYGDLTINSSGGGQFGGTGPSYTGEEWGAAMQLAIWTDLYGAYNSSTGTGFSFDPSSFSDANVVTLMDDILSSSANTNPNLGEASTLWLATAPTASNQSFIGPVSTPEPGTISLLVTGLLGAWTIRRRNA
jgi:hypothetical protein